MLLINIDQNLPEMISIVEWVILPQCTLRYHAYLKVPKPGLNELVVEQR